MLQTSPFLLPLSSLSRVGPVVFESLQKLLGSNRIFDLLLHRPVRAEKILVNPSLFDVANDTLIIIKARVESHLEPRTSKQPHKIICYTPSGYVNLVFFKTFPGQMAKIVIGSDVAILGRLQKISGENQIVHPQEILPAVQLEKLPKIDVIYPLSYALTQKFLRTKIAEILQKIPSQKEDWIDKNLLLQQGWMSFSEALKKIHNPQSEEDFLPQNPARKRLAYDELLAWQLAVLMVKQVRSGNAELQLRNDTDNCGAGAPRSRKFISSLPFAPTHAQLKAINEISADIASPKKMLRLLQGDVGSGKTVVAIHACLQAIAHGRQACVIAPTTILAKQHFAYFGKLLAAMPSWSSAVPGVALLTSATTAKQKSALIEKLRAGEIDILIATHAVLEDDVQFKNLGLAVIDEQHRFGVMQRLKLVEKGANVDVLLMSATPIPRSLMMALYGDMDISVLSEKPQNRQKISTLVMSEKKTGELYEAMKRAVSRGEKIYWICPLIEESEEVQLTNVKEKFAELAKIFGENSLALLHGKMKEKEKDAVMQKFADPSGVAKILVATTVIEVGIDVPDATVIVIENAENFGLSQLHQLRGRVGRSDKKSFCILLYGEKYGVNARARLNILRESDDGFFIAEEDLKMRGSGELLGTRQSGFPEFKIANLMFDSDLLKIAHKNAEVILHRDPLPVSEASRREKFLHEPSSQKFHDLMQLFGYDECLKMPASG